ncbi:unnamed protein product [Mortierella alpina]
MILAQATGTRSPTVTIFGAGLRSLMLRTLSERAGIHYAVFEQALQVKPLSRRGVGKFRRQKPLSPSMCMVGVAIPKDPFKCPQLQAPFSHLSNVVGGNRRLWSVGSVPENPICWALVHPFENATDAEEKQHRNSEWGLEAHEAVITELREFTCRYGGTMVDLIDGTPKDLISTVSMVEQFFEVPATKYDVHAVEISG